VAILDGRRHRRLLVSGLVVLALVGGCTSSRPGASSPGSVSGPAFTPVGTRIPGGAVTWAESPGFAPNYIFPFYSPQYCTSANAVQLQPLLYRPLYWYGNGDEATVDYDYSIGDQPTFSRDGKTVTITLKQTYTWSDGEPVDARDVIFWMNLMKANKADWCSYVPGYFPDNVVSYSATGPYTVRLVMDHAYNPTWLIYNELSQITPIPLAWDSNSSGLARTKDNGHLPDSTGSGAVAVYDYLSSLAKDTSTYATSPIWTVIDGPFRLARFTSSGEADFVPNPAYTGPEKAQISEFKELPFTSNTSEVALAHTRPGALTVGYLPIDQLPEVDSLRRLGYNLVAAYTFSSDYFPLNQNNPTFGALFRQPYFRQAFQHLVDQSGWIKKYESIGGKAYAIPTYGLVPLQPPSPFLAPGAASDPDPFSVATASRLLSSHGWTVEPDGVTTCTHPGSKPDQCGKGVPGGQNLVFNLDYASGLVYLDSEMKALEAAAAMVGIQLQLTTHPLGQVVQTAVQCQAAQPACAWTAENWGAGWDYSPDFYPSGEEVVETMADGNYSNYSNDQMDDYIGATTLATPARAQSALDTYQGYVRQQLPFVFEPDPAGNPQPAGPALVSNHLGGFDVNAFGYITPETYYLTR
jgi:peptide/nickel transport system substrate-binding protein